MRRRTRTTRYTQADLNALALSSSGEFQKVSVQALLGHRWNVTLIKGHPYGHGKIVIMRHSRDESVGVAVYPDGSFARAKGSTVKWNWDRVEQAHKSGKPDAYVQNILDGNAPGPTVGNIA